MVRSDELERFLATDCTERRAPKGCDVQTRQVPLWENVKPTGGEP
jgi:hypothetical protein